MSEIILDADTDSVKIKSGLEVTDPYGSGVIISSEGGGDMIVKASSGSSWQGGLQVLDQPNGKQVISLSNLGIGFYETPAVVQAARVGQLPPNASLAQVIKAFNQLELVLHNIGVTK